MTAEEIISYHVDMARRANRNVVSNKRGRPRMTYIIQLYSRSRDKHMAMARKVWTLNNVLHGRD